MLAPSAALAQDIVLPVYAYDMLAEVTFALNADAKCDGIKSRAKNVEGRIADLYKQLMEGGVEPGAAVVHFATPYAQEQVDLRSVALLEKYDAAPDSDADFCRAVRAEAAQNKTLAKLMRIR
ncbi:MAG: hypothetical protein ACC619_04395 [Paracoccaceae bacterium]